MAKKRGAKPSRKSSRPRRRSASTRASSGAARVTGAASTPKATRVRSWSAKKRPSASRAAKKRSAGRTRPASRALEVPGGIPEKQWSLPAGFVTGSRRTAALKRVVDPNYHTTDVHELDEAQRCELTLKRIARQRTFEFMTLDGQTITKRRALGEVRKLTPLGRTLIDIEHRTIALMCEWIRTQQLRSSSAALAGVLPIQGDASEAFRAHLEAPAAGTPADQARARRSSRARTTKRSAAARTPAHRQPRRPR